jgi:heterodisulfide reductase subunit A
MYIGKQAMLYKHVVPDGQAYVFYIDIRSAGKDYEEFIQRAVEDYGVIYLRGKVSKLFEQDGKIIVWGSDTLTGKSIELEADMVILGMAAIPSEGIEELAKKLRVPTRYGWLTEAHLKLRPAETLTSGIFIAGAAQYPKDITDSVAQGSAAAAKIINILTKEYIEREPMVAYVDNEICSGCGLCVAICPYDAIEIHKIMKIAVVNEKICEGCGGCSAICRSGAIQIKNVFKQQIIDMVDEVTTAIV